MLSEQSQWCALSRALLASSKLPHADVVAVAAAPLPLGFGSGTFSSRPGSTPVAFSVAHRCWSVDEARESGRFRSL